MTAAFNNRTIFNYSIRRRLFESGFKRQPVSKNITIGPFNRERRLPFCSLKINWSIENECAKIIFSDEAKIEVGAHKKIYVWRKRMNGSTLTVLVLSQIKKKRKVLDYVFGLYYLLWSKDIHHQLMNTLTVKNIFRFSMTICGLLLSDFSK